MAANIAKESVTIEGYEPLRAAAEKKSKLYKSHKGPYFIYSMLAGLFVGFCMILIMVIAGLLGGWAMLKMVQGASFAAALSLIVYAGSELFTGNVFTMTTGYMMRKVTVAVGVGLVVFCWLGNFAGSIVVAALYQGTGLLSGATLEAVNAAVWSKTDGTFIELFFRGIGCNVLVCLAVWACYRMTSEAGKLIMIFWCIYLFVVMGFEHSIANMTLFSLEVFGGTSSEVVARMAKNLAASTLGNAVGGMALAYAYWPIARGLTKVAAQK